MSTTTNPVVWPRKCDGCKRSAVWVMRLISQPLCPYCPDDELEEYHLYEELIWSCKRLGCPLHGEHEPERDEVRGLGCKVIVVDDKHQDICCGRTYYGSSEFLVCNVDVLGLETATQIIESENVDERDPICGWDE